MQPKQYTVESACHQPLDVLYYAHETDEQSSCSRTLIQILHGMQEHKERYHDFAEFLFTQGYDVLIHDHLGHGKSVSRLHPLGDMVSADTVLKDIDIVRKSVPAHNETVCFGHSMGSFLARIYASLYDVDVLIACGTGQTPGFLAHLIKLLLLTQPSGVPLSKIQKLITGSFTKRGESPTAWLSVDLDNQRRYREDPLCGQPFTKEGYETLMDIVLRLNHAETYRNCSAKRILLIAGEKDPVGQYTKGVRQTEEHYLSAGKNVRNIFYPNMAHEILLETDHLRVYQDVAQFLQKKDKH